MGAGTSRPRKFWVARAGEVWRRDVSNPEVIEGVDRGWDVSSQEVLGCEGGARRRDVASPEVIVGLDGGWDVSSQEVLGCEGGRRRRDVASPERVDLTADGADNKDRESMAAGMALSRTSDFARPAQRPPHPRNPRNPWSLLCSVTRRASFLGSARRTSAFRLRSRVRRPADHADGRRTGRRLGAHRLRSLRGRRALRAFFRRCGIAEHRD